MLSLVPPLRRRLEFVSFPCIAFSFWTLLVLVQINLQGSIIRPQVLGVMLVCCLLLLSFVSPRWWKSPGTAGVLLLAAIASYLVIASVVPFFTDAELQRRDVARQAFFLIVTLAAILGGRALLERIGVEALLKWSLVALSASCIVILASSLLRDIGALPEYRITRFTGAFTDPNDAGFVACITTVLAMAFLYRGRQAWLGYPAMLLGYAAAFSTVSITAIALLGVVSAFFLLVNARRLKQALAPAALTVLGIAAVLTFLSINFHLFEVNLPTHLFEVDLHTQKPEEPTPTPAPTLARSQLELARERVEAARGETVSGNEGRLGNRINLWIMGLEKVREEPVVGHGLHQLRTMEGAPLGYHYKPAGVHNTYLMLIGEAGFIPLALYVLALFFLARFVWISPTSLGGASVVGSAIVMATFSMAFHHLVTMGAYNFLIGLVCALAGFLIQERRNRPQGRSIFSGG